MNFTVFLEDPPQQYVKYHFGQEGKTRKFINLWVEIVPSVEILHKIYTTQSNSVKFLSLLLKSLYFIAAFRPPLALTVSCRG